MKMLCRDHAAVERKREFKLPAAGGNPVQKDSL